MSAMTVAVATTPLLLHRRSLGPPRTNNSPARADHMSIWAQSQSPDISIDFISFISITLLVRGCAYYHRHLRHYARILFSPAG